MILELSQKKKIWAHKKICPICCPVFSAHTLCPNIQFCSQLCPVQLEQTKNPRKSLLVFTTNDCASQVEAEGPGRPREGPSELGQRSPSRIKMTGSKYCKL